MTVGVAPSAAWSCWTECPEEQSLEEGIETKEVYMCACLNNNFNHNITIIVTFSVYKYFNCIITFLL